MAWSALYGAVRRNHSMSKGGPGNEPAIPGGTAHAASRTFPQSPWPAAPKACIRREIGYLGPAGSCRSSVVEHSLGKGEAQSSNLCGSTSKTTRQIHYKTGS